MATPTLKTLEAEAADSTQAPVSPKVRTQGVQAAPTGTAPLVTPRLRTFGVQAASSFDASPPAATLDSPTAGDKITGSVLLQATASDPE